MATLMPASWHSRIVSRQKSGQQGVKLIGAQKASLYSFAEPVTAAIISTFVLGSPFTMWDALGFACIFIMLVLLSLPEKKHSGVETAC